MARANIATGLSLDQWAEVMGFELFQFNQVGGGPDSDQLTFGREAQCDTVWYQFSYQKQFLSRTEIALAIAQAEAVLFKDFGYHLSPKYRVADEHSYPNDSRLKTPDWLTPRGEWKSVNLRGARLQGLGVISRTVIEADASYTPSDTDGDGIDDTFTVSIATEETDPANIALYFSGANRDALDETWRIRPVVVTINSGTATITGHLAQLVNPALQLSLDPSALQVNDVPSIYVPTVDVYVVKPDETTIGTAYWNRREGVRLASTADITIADIDNNRTATIRPVINACTLYQSAPDRVEINYLSGLPLDSRGRVREPYAQIIAYLSCAYLPALACGCDRAEQKLEFMRNIPSDGEQGNYPITIEQVNEIGAFPVRGAFQALWLAERYKEMDGLGI